jgi:hypothetical protein
MQRPLHPLGIGFKEKVSNMHQLANRVVLDQNFFDFRRDADNLGEPSILNGFQNPLSYRLLDAPGSLPTDPIELHKPGAVDGRFFLYVVVGNDKTGPLDFIVEDARVEFRLKLVPHFAGLHAERLFFTKEGFG